VAPRPRGAPEPAPSPAPAPEPPPVESDLAVHTPNAAPQPQGTPDRSAERDRARREALMRAALEGARPGDRDQEATDPRGTADETIRTGSGGIPADPELARWKARAEDQFNDPFNPLPTIVAANPGITAVYRVTIDPRTGRVVRWQVLRSSGNASYDAAVERAISSVPAIDPPPERFIDVVGSVLDVTFEPKGR
jgi:hypothetical protein